MVTEWWNVFGDESFEELRAKEQRYEEGISKVEEQEVLENIQSKIDRDRQEKIFQTERRSDELARKEIDMSFRDKGTYIGSDPRFPERIDDPTISGNSPELSKVYNRLALKNLATPQGIGKGSMNIYKDKAVAPFNILSEEDIHGKVKILENNKALIQYNTTNRADAATHELVHNLMHNSGYANRVLKDRLGDQEILTRAITHKLRGGKLSDAALLEDIETITKKYTFPNLPRFSEIGTDVNIIKYIDKVVEHFDTYLLQNFSEGEPTINRRSNITIKEDLSKELQQRSILALNKVKQREGDKNYVYRDSRGFLTAGIGHKLTPKESKIYKEGDPISIKKKMKWFKEDTEEAWIEALSQATKTRNLDLVEPLFHVNFQLGTNWIDKFPKTWNYLLEQNYEAAIKEVALNNSGGPSLWLQQTPKRVKDFQQGLQEVIDKRNEREQRFKSKKSKLISYPIGVDTPIFKTQEEADAYMDELPKALRSNIKGMIQGAARYSGVSSIPAIGELGAYSQAALPLYERGLLSQEETVPPSFLEAEDKYTKKIGKTLVPRETDDSSVWITEQAVGLGMLGVAGKQGIDLIRQYGPQAVSKLKSYFTKNPKATVDEAVNGIMNKGITRRDVIKGAGAGAAVAGTAGKIGTSLLTAGKGISSTVLHPKHAILNDSLSKLIKYRGTKAFGSTDDLKDPVLMAVDKTMKTDYPWLFQISEGRHKTGFSDKPFRTIEKHFKKHDLDLGDDVINYDSFSDERNWDRAIHYDDFEPIPNQLTAEDLRPIFDRADEIYLGKVHDPYPEDTDFFTNFVTLNKKLDTLKNKKDPAFKGKENGVELFEIDGSPIARKTDHSWAEDEIESIFLEMDLERTDMHKYFDKVILMPNNKGIAKLNK